MRSMIPFKCPTQCSENVTIITHYSLIKGSGHGTWQLLKLKGEINYQPKVQLECFWLLRLPYFSLDRQLHYVVPWKGFNCTSFPFQGQLKRQFKWTKEEVEKN